MWECESCGVENDLDPDLEEGQFTSCTECTTEFEVVSLEPLQLVEIELPESTVPDDDGEDDAWGDDD